MDTVMRRIADHVKDYIIAYLTAVMVYGMVFGICIEQAHADNAPTAAERVHSRTRQDNGQRTAIELREIER